MSPFCHFPKKSGATRAPLNFDLRGLEAAATAATTTTEVATRGATFTLLGFIDLQRTTTEVFAIERLHGAGGIGIRHFNEAEATGASGLAIVHERHLFNSAVGCEEGAHLIFGGGERQISNVKFRHRITHKNIGQMTGLALSAGSRMLWDCGARGTVSTKNCKPPATVQETFVPCDNFWSKM